MTDLRVFPRRRPIGKPSLSHRLVSAVFHGALEEVKRTCALAGGRLARMTDEWGRSPLHVAASLRNGVETLNWLLENAPFDKEGKDPESGWTALHRAIYYGNLQNALSLLKRGGSLQSCDRELLTPLDLVNKNRLLASAGRVSGHTNSELAVQSEFLAWGLNNNMTLGHADASSKSIPEKVAGLALCNVSEVVLCKFHTVFLCADGRLFTCGVGQGGRLGHGDEQTHVIPSYVKSLHGVRIVSVAAARNHTVILSDSGAVSACGINDYCQVGSQDSSAEILSPRKINVLKGKRVTLVAAGRYHSAVCTKSELFTWGKNEGQLGYCKADTIQAQPKQVTLIPERSDIVMVCASDAATACLVQLKGGGGGSDDVYVMHEYGYRKISLGLLGLPVKMALMASLGQLQGVEQDGACVFVGLFKDGRVWKWSPGLRAFRPCQFANKCDIEGVHIVDMALGKHVFLTTDEGQVYRATFPSPPPPSPHRKEVSPLGRHTRIPKGRKSFDRQSSKSREWEADSGRVLELTRVPHLHRVQRIFCDYKGQNIMAVALNPIFGISGFPLLSPSQLRSDLERLLAEADLFDPIHDYHLQLGARKLPAHRVILADASRRFRRVFQNGANDDQINFDSFDVQTVNIVLFYIYTGQCKPLEAWKGSRCRRRRPQLSSAASETDNNEMNFVLDLDEVDGLREIDWSVEEVHFESVLAGPEDAAGRMSGQRRGERKPILSPNSTSAFARFQTSVVSDDDDGGGADADAETTSLLRRDSVPADEICKEKEFMKTFQALPEILQKVYKAAEYLEVFSLVQTIERDCGLREHPVNDTCFGSLDREAHLHLCDISLVANDGTTFLCHKCILSARLDYFYSMLNFGWREASSDLPSVNLPFSSKVLKVVLDFLYTDTATVVEESTNLELIGQILIAADQMLVTQLKQICELSLAKNLNLRNVVDIVDFADTYGASQLKKTTLDYICVNLAALLEGGFLLNMDGRLAEELAMSYQTMIPLIGARQLKMSAIPVKELALSPRRKDGRQCRASPSPKRDRSKSTDSFDDSESSVKSKDLSPGPPTDSRVEREKTDPHSPFEKTTVEQLSEESLTTSDKKSASDFLPEVAHLASKSKQCPELDHTVGEKPGWSHSPTAIDTVSSLVEIMALEEDKQKTPSKRNQKAFASGKRSVNLMKQFSDGNAAIRWSVRSDRFRKPKSISGETSDLEEPTPSPPTNPWGIANLPSPPSLPFKNLIAAEEAEHKRQSSSVPLTLPRPTTPRSRGWESAVATSPVHTFSDILRSEELATDQLERLSRKPLAVIQIEEKAISELFDYYGGPYNPEEHVIVKRLNSSVSPGVPLWNKQT
eukprot:m.149009 g.149009  ORF g.149009 m.149009 type:complete len:1342 (+) comp38508_c0_seq60:189-4214(+)